MPIIRRGMVSGAALLFLFTTAQASQGQVQPSASNSAVTTRGPSRLFAPYVDLSKPVNDLVNMHAQSGLRHFTLAFVVAGSGCSPSWGGSTPVANDTMTASYIKQLRQAGG